MMISPHQIIRLPSLVTTIKHMVLDMVATAVAGVMAEVLTVARVMAEVLIVARVMAEVLIVARVMAEALIVARVMAEVLIVAVVVKAAEVVKEPSVEMVVAIVKLVAVDKEAAVDKVHLEDMEAREVEDAVGKVHHARVAWTVEDFVVLIRTGITKKTLNARFLTKGQTGTSTSTSTI